MISPDPFPASPVQAVRTENGVRFRAAELIMPRVRRALRAAFIMQENTGMMGNRTRLSIDVGEAARSIQWLMPDVAFFVSDARFATRPNRAPGDIRPHWKWSSAMAAHANPNDPMRMKGLQALSQLNYYMKQYGTRYGFLLTDHELVAIRRLDDNGNLELSQSIPWGAGGNAAQPVLTVMLAFWYLGMLAANDQGALAWNVIK